MTVHTQILLALDAEMRKMKYVLTSSLEKLEDAEHGYHVGSHRLQQSRAGH